MLALSDSRQDQLAKKLGTMHIMFSRTAVVRRRTRFVIFDDFPGEKFRHEFTECSNDDHVERRGVHRSGD